MSDALTLIHNFILAPNTVNHVVVDDLFAKIVDLQRKSERCGGVRMSKVKAV